jgi:hypothetical protein
MASKKPVGNKPQKNKGDGLKMLIYRIVFVVISLILLFSLILSAVTTF